MKFIEIIKGAILGYSEFLLQCILHISQKQIIAILITVLMFINQEMHSRINKLERLDFLSVIVAWLVFMTIACVSYANIILLLFAINAFISNCRAIRHDK